MGVDIQSDFLKFIRRQLTTSDFDAEHPLHIWLQKKHKIVGESARWLSFLYMAFYDEASAWCVFNSSDPFTVPKDVSYPIGMNRRNLFGGKVTRHFTSLKEVRAKAKEWPTHNFTGDFKRDWIILNDNLGQVWGNGRFAKYTTAEMLQKVNGLPVEITGFDNKDSSGPADGIQRLYKCSSDLATLDRYGEEAYNKVVRTGLAPRYTQLDRGVVESLLCTFSGLCRGRFYSGRNVDRQQARILRVEEETGEELATLWEARQAVFRSEDLGENQGWAGIDKERLTHYLRTGKVLWTWEERGEF